MENFTRNYSHPAYPPQYYMFQFERDFSLQASSNWMKKYWSLSFVLVFFYIILIHLGQKYMKDRPRFSLRGPLFVWNLFLSILYIVGLIRSAPAAFSILFGSGYHDFVCAECPFECNRVAHAWAWIFIIFKAPELLDTAFVVLRKQPLFFLHWYHHCTVLVFTWYLYSHVSAAGALFGYVNSLVHALMYSYYTLKSLSISVPRPVSMALTIIQISQMVIGCLANYYVYQVKKVGVLCPVTYTDIWASFIIYISYFVLFLWYFYQAYIAKDALMIAKFKGQKIE